LATNRELRTALLKRLGVSSQRLYQIIADLKKSNGPMSTEDATYVIAHLRGLDLSRFLDAPTVDRVRGLVPRNNEPVSAARDRAKRSPRASRPIRLGSWPAVVDAFLPSAIAEDAARMATIYSRLYVLENSIRIVISRILAAKYGKDWWSSQVPAEVRNQVDQRKASESKKPWHGRRGSHEIYYSDFSDLRRLIVKNWPDFIFLFPSQHWIGQKLEELEAPRNIVAHNNPLSAGDQRRIELYFDDWMALLRERAEDIP
jgi:hypothetical protein